jgi:glycosyltransferase involved in cell wall biosynthesis
MPGLTLLHVDAERGFSGGEEQVFLLLEGLRARGQRSVLAAPPGSAALAAAERRGFERRAVAMRSDLDLPAVLELARLMRELAPDLVHLHTGRATWLGALAALRAGIPAVATRRMDKPIARGARPRLLYGRWLAATAAISPAVERQLLDAGAPRERVRLIQSSVDPAALVPRRPRAEVRAELGAEPDALVVLVLANLVRRKGIDVLLAALAKLEPPPARGSGCRPWRLWVAGEGEERAALEAQSRALGLAERARFLGRRADKAELLGACDVVALPSRAEGLGVAALEAQAAGRAVVASRIGGLAEAVVDGRTGLLVAPGDAGALAEALERLRAEPGLAAALGHRGPARIAEGFEARTMVEAYEALYGDVLAARRPARHPLRR